MRQADVLQAIQGSGAVMSTIAKRLDCAWHTARKWCNKWEATRQALEDEEQRILDLAESKLYESIHNGNTQDAKWLLAYKGKGRGYSEKHEIEHSGPGGGPVKLEVAFVDSDED